MRLVDIDLSCPDRYPRARQFYELQQPVQEIYERHLGRVDMKRAGKVLIYAASGAAAQPRPELYEDVLDVPMPFDFSGLWAEKDEFRRQKLVLALLHKALLKAARFVRADTAPFEAAYKATIDELRAKATKAPSKRSTTSRAKSRAKGATR
jgi:hypothetical protein